MVRLDQLETIVSRPALSKDTKEVMELSSHIWEGNDYIPQVWDEWLADPDGLLGVAELGGRVVGVFKLTKFDDQEWYMEGLRVHPDVQGQGIASHIHNYVVDTWRHMGGGVIRLTTGSYNVKVHRMCEQSGFKRIAEFIPYRAPVLHEKVDTFSALGQREAEQALEFVMSSPVHALSSRLINLAWVFGNTRLRHIQEAIAEGHAWWWKGGMGFISIWEDTEDERREPGVQLLACPVSELRVILEDYRRLTGELGYESAGWVAPNQPEVIPSLEKAGFQRSWDVSLYIYELNEITDPDQP